MNPARKRQIRLVVALTAAVLLATALVYTSFNASSEAKSPSELLSGAVGDGTYEVYGKVVPGSIQRDGADMTFEIADREDPSVKIPVEYTGQVPDPFRDGREVIVTGRLENGTLVAEKDQLITKCPSKFAAEAEADPEHVIIDESLDGS
jgi:Cytochrome c-type biogenesis protein CcmE